MRSLIVAMVLLGGCVTHVDSAPVQDADAGDAGIEDVGDAADGSDGAVSLCGDVILQQQQHPEQACSVDSECLAKKTGNACICGLCVTSY